MKKLIFGFVFLGALVSHGNIPSQLQNGVYQPRETKPHPSNPGGGGGQPMQMLQNIPRLQPLCFQRPGSSLALDMYCLPPDEQNAEALNELLREYTSGNSQCKLNTAQTREGITVNGMEGCEELKANLLRLHFEVKSEL